MCKRWLMLLSIAFFAIGMVLSFDNVYAATSSDQEEVTSEIETSASAKDSVLSENTSADEDKDSEICIKKNDKKSNSTSDSKSVDETESDSDVKDSKTSSGGSTVIVQSSDDSTIIQALINEYIKGRDTLNGFQKQVLDRLDVMSICCIVSCAIAVCSIFILN